MRRHNNTTTYAHCLLTVIIVFSLAISGCSDNPTDDESSDDPSGNTAVEGSINNYDLGEEELYKKEDFVDLIKGTIENDGSFTVNFLGIDKIEEALKPLGNDSSDDFVAMYCRDAISQSLDSNNLFVGINSFNFTYGEDSNVAMIGLTSGAPNINVFPPQSDNKGDYQVRWIYSNKEITISEECSASSSSSRIVDLELSEGWNEVNFDISDSDNIKQYTGERPNEVDWALDQ